MHSFGQISGFAFQVHSCPHSRYYACTSMSFFLSFFRFTSNCVYNCLLFKLLLSLCLFFSFALERTVLAPIFLFSCFVVVFIAVAGAAGAAGAVVVLLMIRFCLSIVWFLFTVFTVPSSFSHSLYVEVPLRNLFAMTKTTHRCLRMLPIFMILKKIPLFIHTPTKFVSFLIFVKIKGSYNLK